MNDEMLAYRSASDSMRLFARGEASPVELMRALLERVPGAAARVNPTTAVFAEAALEQAKLAEARYRAGTQRPLEGVPVAIKEETAVAGWRRTIGSWLYDETPGENHPIVDKLIAAGAIPHLQTTVPEFCLIGQTWSRRFGVTRNPWNPSVTPGGSSGGSGAALAAGIAPLATGSDMAGSIRIPAALCGVYGYKPPFNRLASTPGEELFAFAVEGPMARSLEDLVRMQNVICGPHPATYSGMPPVSLPLAGEGVRGLRIALSLTTGQPAMCADSRRNLERACALLEAQGAIIEPVELRWDGERLADALLGAIFAIFLDEYLEKLPAERLGEGTSYLRWLIATYGGRRGSIMKGAAAALELHQELQSKLWGRGIAALICPTVFATDVAADLDLAAHRRIPIGSIEVDSYLGWVGTPPFNLLCRYPALAVPTGLAANGVPTSLQVVGPAYADEIVFRVAAAYDRVADHGLYSRHFPAVG
ncbi:MAG: amidase [Gammaproteobacteria bacterium]|nr:amidase [Gammaproteobacteria bacterium]